MSILMTAFEPFGKESVNSALEALHLLPDTIQDVSIIKLEVPTVFGKSIQTVVNAIDEHSPGAVVCIGQAGGRFAVTPERVAINIDDASLPDNEGNAPADAPICEDGPSAYFSTLPIKAIVREIRKEGLPAGVSDSAGTFVCNHLLYGVLHHIHIHALATLGGFIHVPFIPEQVVRKASPLPSMSREDIARALQAAVRAVIMSLHWDQ